MTWQELIDKISPLLVEVLSVVGTALLAWIGASARRWAAAADARNKREELHSDLETGALAAASLPNATVREITAAAIDFAGKGSPEIINGMNAKRLGQMAHAKALQAKSTVNSVTEKA
jgi:hypothetical protein